MVIDTPEECQIAHMKFDPNINFYVGKTKSASLPAGCHCTAVLTNCTQTKFNEIVVTSGKINVAKRSRGICRLQGGKYKAIDLYGDKFNLQ